MKLFVLYVGGKTSNSLIELHDMRFAVAEKLEETYDALRASWWGTPKSLHLDCWGELNYADGYNIVLRSEPSLSEDRLYFVNLGGYDGVEFTELHKNIFVVAPTESKAMVKALKTVDAWKGRHKDNLFEVEQVFCISDVAREKGLFVHLELTDTPVPFVFEQGYRPLGR